MYEKAYQCLDLKLAPIYSESKWSANINCKWKNIVIFCANDRLTFERTILQYLIPLVITTLKVWMQYLNCIKFANRLIEPAKMINGAYQLFYSYKSSIITIITFWCPQFVYCSCISMQPNPKLAKLFLNKIFFSAS